MTAVSRRHASSPLLLIAIGLVSAAYTPSNSGNATTSFASAEPTAATIATDNSLDPDGLHVDLMLHRHQPLLVLPRRVGK
jgi:hypothetical protein